MSDESEGEYSDISCSDEPDIQQLPGTKEIQIQENMYNFTETAPEHEQSTAKILKLTKFKKTKDITAMENPVVLQKRLSKVGKKSKFIRMTWTEEQKATAKKYFQKHILLRKPPKKEECDDFLVKNQMLMSGNKLFKILLK